MLESVGIHAFIASVHHVIIKIRSGRCSNLERFIATGGCAKKKFNENVNIWNTRVEKQWAICIPAMIAFVDAIAGIMFFTTP